LKYYDGSYAAEGDDVTGNTKLKDTFLWAGLLGLLGLFLASSLAFIGLMDREGSAWAPSSAGQQVRNTQFRRFLEGRRD